MFFAKTSAPNDERAHDQDVDKSTRQQSEFYLFPISDAVYDYFEDAYHVREDQVEEAYATCHESRRAKWRKLVASFQ